ncbi:DUF6957 family protein [Pseudomonas aeruginosa]|uniref:DUF6957 family protein n=1 Tax=Pseudomonas aeruginosa TaxID=287 RepID=UPI0012DC72E2|nr:hypothetical protein [Pseudomonas aeruginosa]
MVLPEAIEEAASIIYGDDDLVPGCALSVDEAKAWLASMEPPRPFCLVADWRWIDLDIPGRSNDLPGHSLPQAILYASNVLFDSRYRFPVGGWVRSTMLVALRDEFIFETRNTRYLMMGLGNRKMASLSTVSSLW